MYGENEKKEISVTKGVRGRQAEVKELYESVFHNQSLFHNGRWGMATLEVCLAILRSAQEKRDIALSHQVAVFDEVMG
jgi:hypothetical protein